MKRWINKINGVMIAWLLIPTIASSSTQVGFVNVAEVFEGSAFVKDANKKLQDEIADMNMQLAQQKKKLKELITQYHALKNVKAKKNLESPLKTEEIVLQNLTISFQKKIHQDEVAGKQHFDILLRNATERVAKAKHINVVVTEQSVLFSDNTWVNLTADVLRELKKATD